MSVEPPRSAYYDDVYFAHDGFAEKRTVFVEGARVPTRWHGRPRFVIGELGFGTGLSMLATWAAAQTHPGFVQFVSVEGHPLSGATIRDALQGFSEVATLLPRFLEVYPERPPGPGVHHFDLSERFCLTLCIGEVEACLSQLDGAIDAWYLDGFAPAKNPAMWTDAVLDQVAHASRSGATLASYTAAGDVRRALEHRAFQVDRVSGFGAKRHRIVATFRGRGRQPASVGSVAVVGAGVAGACLARSLFRRGVAVTVFDGERARGASQNPLAVLSPRINRLDDPQSRVHVRSFEYASRLYRAGDGFAPVGVLRLAVDAELTDRLEKGLSQGPLRHGPSRAVTAEEASERAGLQLAHSGVWLPEGGLVDPSRLLPVLAQGAEFRAADVRAFDFDFDRQRYAVRAHSSTPDATVDAVAVASGAWAKRWLPELPLRVSRGQLSLCEGGEIAARLGCVLSAHGYVSPRAEPGHLVGASYGRVNDLDRTEPTARDDLANLERIALWAPALAADLSLLNARASFRCLVPDHMPLVGRAGALYTVSALGSRGFALAPLAAEVVASELTGTVPPMERAQRAVISPERYLPV